MNQTLEQQLKEKLKTFNYEITNDFIGVFDGVFSNEFCKNWIKHFDHVDSAGLSYSRVQAFDRPSHINKDQAIDFLNCSFQTHNEMRLESSDFDKKFWEFCYLPYVEKYSILQNSDPHKIYTVKIQKTTPGGGYHAWHFESANRYVSTRLLTFILYLNDIEDGGETEFLYLSKRIKPKEGRLVLWPAGFTHTHRGNPPLKENKYIITGWVEF